jgi:hypothetical protein
MALPYLQGQAVFLYPVCWNWLNSPGDLKFEDGTRSELFLDEALLRRRRIFNF